MLIIPPTPSVCLSQSVSVPHLDCYYILLLSLFQERFFLFRMLPFFFLVIVIIIQNLVFGVIIDTFSDLRAEKNKEEDMIKNTCFICGTYVRMCCRWAVRIVVDTDDLFV